MKLLQKSAVVLVVLVLAGFVAHIVPTMIKGYTDYRAAQLTENYQSED